MADFKITANNKLAWNIYQALKDNGAEIGTASVSIIERALDQAEAERWIPVERRMPEDDGRYLVLRTHGYRDIMIYDSAIKRFVIKDVTHWQPLPPPPGERAEPGEDDDDRGEYWPDMSANLRGESKVE